MLRELDEREQVRGREVTRKEDIRKKNKQAIVKHPANHHIWVPLAHFIEEKEQIDLEGVEERRRNREIRRAEIERKRQIQEEVEREKQRVDNPLFQQ